MSKGLVYLRPMRLVCLRATGAYEDTVVSTWKRLDAWLGERGIAATSPRYGLFRDNPNTLPAAECRYDAACALPDDVDAAGSELMAVRMPGGTYQRHRVVGRYDDLHAKAFAMCTAELPSRGLAVAPNRPLVVVYFSDPLKRDADNLKAEICLPVSASVGDAAA